MDERNTFFTQSSCERVLKCVNLSGFQQSDKKCNGRKVFLCCMRMFLCLSSRIIMSINYFMCTVNRNK